jgi:hypothetical protein
MKYCWSATSYEADANKVGKELERIERKEELTRESVSKFAKNKKSELHKCFEWDDSIAGEKYRLYQASNILTSISIVYEEEPKRTTRMYVSIKNAENQREYKNIVSVLENDEEYQQLLDKAERDFVSYKDKYQNMIQLNDLKNIIFKNI